MVSFNSLKKIVFIESNTTGTGEEFIKSAFRNNFGVIFITSNPTKYKFIDELLIYPILLDTSSIEIIYNYLKDIPDLVAVISTSELFVYKAAKVANLLSLPHNNPESIEKCRNKYIFNKFLADAKLAHIKTKIIDQNNCSEFELTELSKEFYFPVIIKPNLATGSTGVKLCKSLEEIVDQVNYLSNIGYLTQGILIQEYIQGEEFSIEIVVSESIYHILGITKKYLSPEPYFVEVGHVFPAQLDNFVRDKICSFMIKALKTINFKLGAVHIEFRIVNQNVYIIEINPRLAGGMIPILIEQSQSIKLIDNLIKLYIGQDVDFTPKSSFITKIEFFLPKTEGKLKDIKGFDKVMKFHNILVGIYKSIGDTIELNHDYTDRLGFIIAKSNNLDSCRKIIISARKYINFKIIKYNTKKILNTETYVRNRLNNEKADTQIKQILEFNFFKNFNEIKLLSDINKAHIVMLKNCNIIDSSIASKILVATDKLEKGDFSSAKKIEKLGIGSYLAYEQSLVNILGIKIAGNMHIARSRNDINATIMRFKSRLVFINLYSAIWKLRAELLLIANNSLNIMMPIYSQYQPAMPGTYAYYLIAIEKMIASHQVQLKQTIDTINTSTMGGVCGSGTTFPIDLNIVAELLGFDYPMPNALFTVSNRNLELTLLSIGAMLGVTISRVAQDYQIWSTQEFGFFDIPDNLCGISSTMPQKKNPYLLEKIKGKSISIIGKLVSSLAVMQKTPFSNSVEVGTESLIGYEEAFNELIKAIKLLQLIVKNSKKIQLNMLKSNIRGVTVATAIAENLVKNSSLSYRESYSVIAESIANSINKKDDPLKSILEYANFPSDSSQWHLQFEYGKGPGRASTEFMFNEAKSKLELDALFFYSKINKWNKAKNLLDRVAQSHMGTRSGLSKK